MEPGDDGSGVACGCGTAAALIEQSGAREWARRKANQEIDSAMTSLAAADCDPRAGAELRALARVITSRDL